MSLPTKALLAEVAKIPAVKEMKTAARCSARSGLIVGAITTIGGIIGGPVGLAIGGVVSSCVEAYRNQGSFQPVPYVIINKTTPEEREKLAELIRECLQTRHLTTLYQFVDKLNESSDLETEIINILIFFLSAHMGKQTYRS